MNKIIIPNQQLFDVIENVIESGKSIELKVKGSSMHPFLINNQHKVVLVPYKREYLHIGAIFLYVYKGKHLLHRLVSINGENLILSGDNMPHTKEIIREEHIIAYVKYIITPTGETIDCQGRKPGLNWYLWKYYSKLRFNFGKLISKHKNHLNKIKRYVK